MTAPAADVGPAPGRDLLRGQRRQRDGRRPDLVRHDACRRPLRPAACRTPHDRHLHAPPRCPGPTTGGSRRTTERRHPIATGPEGRFTVAGDPPTIRSRRRSRRPAARRQQRRPPEPVHPDDRQLHRADHAGAEVDAGPAHLLLHGLRQPATRASPTCWSRATRSRRRRNSMYAPALDNRAHTYPDSQAGEVYYWHVRPCRAMTQLRSRPGDRQDARSTVHSSARRRSDGLTRDAATRPAPRSPSRGTTTRRPTGPALGADR